MRYFKRNQKQRILTLVLSFLMLLGIGTKAYAANDSYTYSIWGVEIPAPPAYELEKSIRAADLKVDTLGNVTDIFYRNSKVYIIMTGKMIITDEEFKNEQVVTSYVRDGKETNIVAPTGIYVTEEGDIYLAEQNAGEIIHLDAQYQFVRALGDPNITGLAVAYAPTKVVVDDVGRIFVKAKSVYEGIVELNPDGQFNRFVGANEVNPSVLDRFYRMIATDEQISRMQLWLPTDYSDIALDKDGFLFATVKDTSSSEPVRKLNSSGNDIMMEADFVPRPMGDFRGNASLSMLTSVACADDGRFAVLDSSKSRIFVYSEDARLLYILGGSGKTEGSLNSPVDLTFMNDRILILDLVTQSIEVYKETEYGSLINTALKYQSLYDYESAASIWQKVLDINNNFYYAHLGIGKHQLRIGDYEGALDSFYRAGEREYYSVAYENVRDAWLTNHFNLILGIIIALIILIIAWKVYRHFHKPSNKDTKVRQVLKKAKYTFITWPFYVLSHPFKAFDDIKYYNDGSVALGVIAFVGYAWMSLINVQYGGFMTNFVNMDEINIIMILLSSVLPFIIFVVANWTIGVLIDGKGNMTHIFKVISYSLYPSIFLMLIGTILSNIVTLDEVAFVGVLFSLANLIFVIYTFIGIIMVHQFTFTKAVASVVLSIISMLIIIFVGLLLVTLVSGFVNDIITIISEVMLHL